MKQPCLYAVCVGVSQYTHINPLERAAADARDLAEVLRNAASPTEIKVLINAAATKRAIQHELKWLAESAQTGDTALVFLSGHGGRQSMKQKDQAYFCPVNASAKAIEQTCITSSELTAALRAIRSDRLVVLLDSCYAGGLGEPRHRGGSMAAGLSSEEVNCLIEGRGRVILAASRADERAWNVDEMRNGLFTNYLLRGLRSEAVRADGTVWVNEFFSYVSSGVRQHQRQHPYQKAIGEDFVVLVQPRDHNYTVRKLDFTGKEIDQRALRLAMHSAYNREELSRLCRDLKLKLEDLPGATLETQVMELIDHCHRHGLYGHLIGRVRADRPHLTLNP